MCVSNGAVSALCRATGGWFAAAPGARTIPSATSSRVALTVRPSAGTSTSLLCYKRSEMLREFLHLCRRGLLHLADFSEHWSAVAVKALP